MREQNLTRRLVSERLAAIGLRGTGHLRLVVFPLAVLLTLFGQHAALAQSAKAKLQDAPDATLRVAMIGANPVLVAKQADGKLGGISFDLGSLIAKRLGVVFVPKIYESPAAYTQSLRKPEWDIAIGPRNSSLEAGLAVTPDFMLVDNLFIAAPGRSFTASSEVDRSGVTVAVARDGAPDKFLSKTLRNAKIVRVSGSVESAVQVLREGKADVYGSNGSFVYDIADQLPSARVIPGPFTTVPMAVAIAGGRPKAARDRISEIVNEAMRTGLVGQAIQRYRLKGVRVAPR